MMSEISERLDEQIENGKAVVKDKYSICRISAKKLALARRSLADARAKANARGSIASATLLAAEKECKAADAEHTDFLAMYEEAVGAVILSYEELELKENDPILAKRARKQADRFAEYASSLRDRLDDILDGVRDIANVADFKSSTRDMDNSSDIDDGVIALGERLASDGAYVVERIATVMEELKLVAMNLSEITEECIKLAEGTRRLKDMKAELHGGENSDSEGDTNALTSAESV